MTKKLLLVCELTQTLLFLHKKTNLVTFDSNLTKISSLKFNDTVAGHQVLYRKGRNEFLQTLFVGAADNVDVGIWTCLNPQLAQAVTKNYFGRFFRKLLFVVPTRREQYEGLQGKNKYHAISIRRNLSSLFQKFPQYSEINTLVITPKKNLQENFKGNDVLIPAYNPNIQGSQFEYDAGAPSICKYVKGVQSLMKSKRIDDARQIVNVKNPKDIFAKIVHSTNVPIDYY